MMNERYLSLKEVAKILGVTSLTLRNWDRRGVLVAYRNPINNYRLYRYADVADLLAEIRKTAHRPLPEVQRLSVRHEEEAVVAHEPTLSRASDEALTV